MNASVPVAPDIAAASPILVAHEVTRRYRAGEVDVTALAGVSLPIDRGEFSLFIGAHRRHAASGKMSCHPIRPVFRCSDEDRRNRLGAEPPVSARVPAIRRVPADPACPRCQRAAARARRSVALTVPERANAKRLSAQSAAPTPSRAGRAPGFPDNPSRGWVTRGTGEHARSPASRTRCPRHARASAWLRLLAGALLTLMSAAGFAQPCASLPADRQVSDARTGCLALLPVGPLRAQPRVLIAMLHGDRGGQLEQRHVEAWTRVGRSLLAEDRVVVFMIRPGYRSPAGDSSGFANPQDDDYTPANVERVAGALATLRRDLRPERVLLVGHSGGAATSALVLGRHPGVADAAVLLGCPCDVPPWRAHRSAQRGQAYRPWAASLNPLTFIGGIPEGTPVLAATGERDDNTLPIFAQRWSEAAGARRVNARAEAVPGLDHASILHWSDLPARVDALIAALGR